MSDKSIYNLLIDLRADVANLQADMNKAAGVVQTSTGKMSSVVRGFFEGLGQGLARGLTQALTNPLQSIKALDAALGRLADAGDEAGAVFDNFRSLGGSVSAIQDAKRAVLGTVDSFDLMRAANEGLIRGIPRLNENFAALAEFANRFADATGQETVPVLNELVNALSTGAPKALKQFGFDLQEGATQAQNQAAAIAQLGQRMAELAPLGESVTQGQERLGAALAEAFKQVGIGVNESAELSKVYNALADAVERIDWRQVGDDVASMVASVVGVLPSLQSVVDTINTMALGLEVFLNKTDRARMVTLQQKETSLREAVAAGEKARRENENLGLLGTFGAGGWAAVGNDAAVAAGEAAKKELERVRAELAPLQTEFKRDFLSEFNLYGPDLPAGLQFDPKTRTWGEPKPRPRPTAGGPTGGGSDLARRKREEGELLKKQLENEQRLARERSDQAAALLEAQAEAQRRQVEDSTGQWADALNVVFGGLGVDPAVGQRMADLGGQIAAGLFSDLGENQGGFFGLGQTIAQGFAEVVGALFGGSGSASGGAAGGGSWADSLRGLFGGSGMTTDEAHQAGIQGPGMADGQFGGQATTTNYAGYAQAGIGAYNDWRNRDRIDRQNKDNRGTGAAVGGTAGAVVGAMFGMPEVGQAVGSALGGLIGRLFKWGSQNPDTQARHLFANWLEKKLEEVGGVGVYENGRFRRLTNFVEGGSGRFNRPGWADEMNGKPGAGAFTGLGEGLRRVLGIQEDVGGQLGAMLFDNMAGDVDNLRMAVKRLGLSFEDVEKAMVEAGNAGEKTWLEVETALAGAQEAFQDGLQGVGDFNKAMRMLLDSGARGFEAVQSVRNIAIEAREAGVKNFDELRALLLKTFDPAVVDAFFESLKKRNIDSLEEIQGLTDRQAGQVVADMQAAGVQFKETGEKLEGATQEAAAQVGEATRAIQDLTNAVRGLDLGRLTAPAPEEEEDAGETAFARGGVITAPTRALMGEAGPEAVLPLARKGGRLGVALADIAPGAGGGMTVNIDARGAAPGVENRLMSAMREMEAQITDRVYRSMAYARGRYA
ncbi:MAG: hypothetical protein K2X87_09220 [Gemmataceae bacterium]|nr:hypothetical protein [Gemmataceae bacterium]